MPKPYPQEFRDDVVRVAQSREDGVSLDQIARDFGVHPVTLQKWMRKADVEAGIKPGTTSAESRELREAKRRVRLLEQENLGISEAVLSRRLRSMCEAGILERTSYERNGKTRQAYVATEAGAELLPVLQQLALWGEKHTTMPPDGGHMAMIHRTCGQETHRGEVCSACGGAMTAGEMTWVKSWRGAHDDLVSAGTTAAGRQVDRADPSDSASATDAPGLSGPSDSAGPLRTDRSPARCPSR